MSIRSMLTTGKKGTSYISVKSEALTSDGQGGFSQTWTTTHRRIPCRFNAMTEKEIAYLWDQQAVQANYKVYMEYVSGIKENDRLVKQGDGREFDVKLVMDWDEDKTFLRLAVQEKDRLK